MMRGHSRTSLPHQRSNCFLPYTQKSKQSPISFKTQVMLSTGNEKHSLTCGFLASESLCFQHKICNWPLKGHQDSQGDKITKGLNHFPWMNERFLQDADISTLLLHKLLKGCACSFPGPLSPRRFRLDRGWCFLLQALRLGCQVPRLFQQGALHCGRFGCLLEQLKKLGKIRFLILCALISVLNPNFKVNAPNPVWCIENLWFWG